MTSRAISRRPTVSVCLPTYNGERFLREQLDSIAAQSVVPDELVVSDDRSTDSSVEVVREFASSTGMTVRILTNDANVGLAANYKQLVTNAASDIIFFADQDDRWAHDKIAKMLAPFVDNPAVDAVASDSMPFDSESGGRFKRTLWESTLHGLAPAPSLAVLARRAFIAGHNLAVRRGALLGSLWPDLDLWADYWIALVFAARGTLALVDEPLVLYRQHDDNEIGIRGRRSSRQNVTSWNRTASTLEAVQKFLNEAGIEVSEGNAELLRRRATFMRRRVAYRREPLRHIATPLRLLCDGDYGYATFANGRSSFAGDVLALLDRPDSNYTSRATGDDDTPPRLALGLYADLSYRRDEDGISSSTAFVAWLAQLASHVDELVIFGRVQPEPARAQFPLPDSPNIRFVALPYYENLHRLGAVARATADSLSTWRKEMTGLDAVLIFGPHPLGDLFGLQARLRGIPVVVGVREDLREYLSYRMTGWKGVIAVPTARSLEALHKVLAINGGAIVVGDDMVALYASPLRPVLMTGISLLQPGDTRPFDCTVHRQWPGDHLIADVVRLDPDKNSMLWLDVAEEVRKLGPWRIEIAGTGRLAEEMQAEIERRALGDVLVLRGRLARSDLWTLYRRATVFIHVSHTEGQPQVLYEAAAAALPMIVTQVGGVAAALGHGSRGMLVPPNDVASIISALKDLDTDPERRQAIVAAAWQWASEDTCDVQTARAVEFVKDVVSDRRGMLPRLLQNRRWRRSQPAGV